MDGTFLHKGDKLNTSDMSIKIEEVESHFDELSGMEPADIGVFIKKEPDDTFCLEYQETEEVRLKKKPYRLLKFSPSESGCESSSSLNTSPIYSKPKRHACFYCKKLVVKMARHLRNVHSKEPEVIKIMSLTNANERKNEFGLLEKLGNYNHNIDVLEGNGNNLILSRISNKITNVNEYGPCPDCYGFYKKKLLWRHIKTCTKIKPVSGSAEKRGTIGESNSLIVGFCDPSKNKGYIKDVMMRFSNDRISRICVRDPLIQKVGFMHYDKYGSSQKENIKQLMRRLGRLLITLCSLTNKKHALLEDFLYPSQFNTVIEGVKKMCEEEIAKKVGSSMKIPPLALRLRHHLKKVINICRREAIKMKEMEREKELNNFILLLGSEYGSRILSKPLNTLHVKLTSQCQGDELNTTDMDIKIEEVESHFDELSGMEPAAIGVFIKKEPDYDTFCLEYQETDEVRLKKKPYRSLNTSPIDSKSKRQACFYCKKLVVKMSRHLRKVHSKEPEVIKIMSLTNANERKNEFGLLEKLGNYNHNIEVLEGKGNNLILSRISDKITNVNEYGPCPDCYGFYKKKLLWKHIKTCKKIKPVSGSAEKRPIIGESSSLIAGFSDPSKNKGYIKDVITRFYNDRISSICIRDPLIQKVGFMDYDKYGSSRKQHIKQLMRQLGRLLITLCSLSNKKHSLLEDFLCPSQFDTVIEGVKKLCKEEIAKEDRSSVKIPSIALRLRHHLKKVINICIGEAIKMKEIEREKELKNFILLLGSEYSSRILSMPLNTPHVKLTSQCQDNEASKADEKEVLESDIAEFPVTRSDWESSPSVKESQIPKITHQKYERRPWSREERNAVLSYFNSPIRHGYMPRKLAIEKCKLKNANVLKNRDWKSIELFVKNYITLLERRAKKKV